MRKESRGESATDDGDGVMNVGDIHQQVAASSIEWNHCQRILISASISVCTPTIDFMSLSLFF